MEDEGKQNSLLWNLLPIPPPIANGLLVFSEPTSYGVSSGQVTTPLFAPTLTP